MQIVSISPSNGQLNIYTNSKVVITFDEAIDPFTVPYGISIYTPTDARWTGPDLAILDTQNSSIMDPISDYEYVSFNYTIDATGKILTIAPVKPFISDRTYYIAIYPGDDASRFLSTQTTSDPVVTAFDVQPTGSVEIVSPYLGEINDTYNITFVNGTQVSVYKDSDGIGSATLITFSQGEPIDIDDLRISINGEFFTGDLVQIDAFAASGLSTLIKNSFTTTHLEEQSFPQSAKITSPDQLINSLTSRLKVTGTIPENFSSNNLSFNPVTIKFNQELKQDQDIQSKITIMREEIETGIVRQVNFYYKISGNIIKLYLTTTK